jgi:hypothetical protein
VNLEALGRETNFKLLNHGRISTQENMIHFGIQFDRSIVEEPMNPAFSTRPGFRRPAGDRKIF